MTPHCCERMSSALEHTCEQHRDPFDCPDTLVYFNEDFSEYGLIVHDGGRSYIVIGFCPWCGARLPESTREKASAAEELELPGPPPFVREPLISRAAADPAFTEALAALRRGDFSSLEPLFQPAAGAVAPDIVRWHAEGRFEGEADALDEALTCASFLGYVDVVRYFLNQGVNASGGSATGMNALHWAANRGQLDVVDALLKARAPWAAKSSYGGNVLDTAVWSAIHEPRPVHQAIVVLLLKAGAIPEDQQFPTGHAGIDGLFRQYGRL